VVIRNGDSKAKKGDSVAWNQTPRLRQKKKKNKNHKKKKKKNNKRLQLLLNLFGKNADGGEVVRGSGSLSLWRKDLEKKKKWYRKMKGGGGGGVGLDHRGVVKKISWRKGGGWGRVGVQGWLGVKCGTASNSPQKSIQLKKKTSIMRP